MWSENSGQRAVLSISGKPRRVIQTCLESLCLKGYSSSKCNILAFLDSFSPSLPPFHFFFPPSLPPSLSLHFPPLSFSVHAYLYHRKHLETRGQPWGLCLHLPFFCLAWNNASLVYCCACQAHWPASFRFFCLCLLSPHRGTGIKDACFSARLHLVLEMQI